MTITFETDSDVIVYALEKVVSFARENQYLFVANCAWWIAGIIRLEQGSIIHIDNLRERGHSASLVGSIKTIKLDRSNAVTIERPVASILPRQLDNQ